MTAELDVASDFPLATDGDIAVINLESARRRSWSRFSQYPYRDGMAEAIVEHEQLVTQYLGDYTALNRLETLVTRLTQVDAPSALIRAQVASMTHRFADARRHLAEAAFHRAPEAAVRRLSLNIDQACGTNLDAVLDARRNVARDSGRLEDLVPLAALLADLRFFDEADRIYRQAMREYHDVSPFALAWVCFQLGMLWGELIANPEPDRATQWYQRAVTLLPCYTKARVHLAEIHSSCGRPDDAQALLMPAVSSGDPEVCWRLADVLAAQGQFADADEQMRAARHGFEGLLARYPLAFADHGAEFYAGSGNDNRMALHLARMNVANRPTLRAFEQAYTIATRAGDADAASELFWAARERWDSTTAFRLSPLAESSPEPVRAV